MKKRGNLKGYNTKIVITPSLKEIWIYESPVIYSSNDYEKESYTTNETRTNKKTYDSMSASEQYDSLKRKQLHYKQMRWEISRLVDCNFDNNTKFMTLTFKNNVTEINYSNNELRKFLKRLNYHFYHQKKQILKYIATWEKQKRGSIHYHIIFFSSPYIPKYDLERLWGHGFIKINQIKVDSKENHGRYVSKYFSKDLELKEHKKKAFFTSQNLKKPKTQKLILSPEEIEELEKESVVFVKEYTRRTYISEAFRIKDNPNMAFHDTGVRYLKIRW